MTLDFGYVRPAVSVGDYVWWDVNKDGVQDDTDKPIEGVTLTISRSDGAPVNNPDGSARAELTTKTDASGKYVFDNLQALPAGVHYVVAVTAPDGFLPTKDGAADRDKDSSAQAGSAESVDLTTDGASDMTLDFGYVAAVSVGDYVWEDVNKDGLQDDTDKPIEGVTLTISRSDGAPVNNSDGSARAELTTTTDASGKYVFDNLEVLPAGTHYVVTVTAPDGFEATKDSAGDRDKDSSAQAGKAESVDLTTNGASDMTLDFGYVRPAVSVGDYVWHDVDRNGVQDDTDKPIEGVTLTISRSDGAPVNNPDGSARAELTTKTDASGKYVFDNLQALPAGVHYVVAVTAPDGFLPTKDGAADRDKDSSAQAGSVESVDLTTDGASDMTLDFGYVRPAVFVGDYVWEDVNKDGLQDDTDKPIQGVTLTISRSDGAPVNNADGSARTELTTQTGPDGKYVFELLEVLPAGVHYVVTVTAPEGFLPTVDNAGDRAVDSSAKAGMAESVDLTDDGASDMTLDFGYVRPEPPVTATPSPKPGKPLAKTGASILVPLMLAGAALGGGSLLVARRRRNG